MNKFQKKKYGQSIVEYALIIAFISIVCMYVLIDGIGGKLKDISNSVIKGLQGSEQLSQQSVSST